MPHANTAAMNAHLAGISRTVAEGRARPFSSSTALAGMARSASRPRQHHPAAAPALRPGTQPRRERLGPTSAPIVSPTPSSRPARRSSRDVAMPGTSSQTTATPSDQSQPETTQKRSKFRGRWSHSAGLRGPQGATVPPHSQWPGTSRASISSGRWIIRNESGTMAAACPRGCAGGPRDGLAWRRASDRRRLQPPRAAARAA